MFRCDDLVHAVLHFEHALDGPVQRAGAQPHIAAGSFGHVLHDRVAMPVARPTIGGR